MLTLADGKTILLDSTSGTIYKQDGANGINVKGKVSYAPSAGGSKEEAVNNKVSTARSNQYQLVLTDRSKVWLNSASSLRFSTSFTGEYGMDGAIAGIVMAYLMQ
jgi:transmembrane sensor